MNAPDGSHGHDPFDNKRALITPCRRDILDPAIDKAISSARSYDNAAVYNELKEMILEGKARPFTNVREGDGAFEYTDVDNGSPKAFTRNALFKRLKRRRK